MSLKQDAQRNIRALDLELDNSSPGSAINLTMESHTTSLGLSFSISKTMGLTDS